MRKGWTERRKEGREEGAMERGRGEREIGRETSREVH